MAKKARKTDPGLLPPDPKDREAFGEWLNKQPREWSVAIAARAAMRVLPQIGGSERQQALLMPALRGAAIARFAAKYPDRASASASASAAKSASSRGAAAAHVAAAADAAACAAAASFHPSSAAYAADAVAFAASSDPASYLAVKRDAQQLYDGAMTAQQLAASLLWSVRPPEQINRIWRRVAKELQSSDKIWFVWVDWYDDALAGVPGIKTEAEDAAFTDIPGELPWGQGARAINFEIRRRLAELSFNAILPEIPEQSPAPVRVEERDGKIAQSSDRDGALTASERDFKAWRDPVADHLEELIATDFPIGTNHSRVRDRLVALDKLLLGAIAEVKERQFRIGYEIERLEGLMTAYRIGGEDMPLLNAAQLEDLDRLRIALKMGIDKLERWSEFRRQANNNLADGSEADSELVGDALDQMAAVMERRPQFFDPELPATFRYLSEALRDPWGATKAIVYGAVKSAENLVVFLAQKALGVGKKGVEAIETHVSKAVAASLVTGLGGAALQLSGALSQGWSWLKPLLAALGGGG
jgi:hypothetical protein